MKSLKKSITGKYNAGDVDRLLLKVRIDYEKCLKEQRDRIFELREENKYLSLMIEKYKSDERYIIGAISKAEETAQSIIKEAEQRAAIRLLEVETEKRQIKVDVEGFYQRLYKLKAASEAIFTAVAKAMGEHEECKKVLIQDNIKPIRAFSPARMIE